jgi:phosphoribosylglycinamide formyltransferase-1
MSQPDQPLQLGILGSGKGSNFVAIQKAIQAGTVNAQVAIVISDLPDAGILDRAREFGLAARALPTGKFKTKLEPEIENQLVAWLRAAKVDLVVLAGYMRVVKEPMLTAYANALINIHPSLLPKFRGLEAWKQALEAGEQKTGCTVHYVDAGVDTGKIIAQREVPILPGDTPETLHARIQEVEHALYPEVIQQLAAARG